MASMKMSRGKFSALYIVGATLTGALSGVAYLLLVLRPLLLETGQGELPQNWSESQFAIACFVAIVGGSVLGLFTGVVALLFGYVARRVGVNPVVQAISMSAGILLSIFFLSLWIFAGFVQSGVTVILVVASAVGVAASFLYSFTTGNNLTVISG